MRTMRTHFPLSRAAAVLLAAIAFILQTGCDKEETAQDSTRIQKLSDLDSGNRKKAGEKNLKDKDLTDEAVQRKALEGIKKAQEQKLHSLEQAEKDGEKFKEQSKSKKKEFDPKAPQPFVKGNSPFVEMPKKLEKGQTSIPVPNNNTKQSNLATMLGDSKHKEISGGSATISDPSNKKQKDSSGIDMKVLQGAGSTELNDPSIKEEKPGIWNRIFGGEKKPDRSIKTAQPGGQVQFAPENEKTIKKTPHITAEKSDGTAFGPIAPSTQRELQDKYMPNGNPRGAPNPKNFKAAPDRFGMMSSAVAAEMAAGSLANQAKKHELKAEENSDAVVVPLDPSGKKRPFTDFDPPPQKPPAIIPVKPETAAAPNSAPTPITGFNEAPAKPAAEGTTTPPGNQVSPASKTDDVSKDVQSKLGSLDDYRRGLESRDRVARERAYQRAVIEKRDDAIPYLVEEVARVGMLAEYASRCLAVMNKRGEAIERALVAGVSTTSTKDANLREACALALGQLRMAHGVPALIDKAKNDHNYSVRAACVAALGQIGDRAAVTTLHMKLDDRGEIEFVKQNAALALAQFGDPAGRAHLLRALDSPMPAMQVMGINGLAQLNDPDIPGLLISRLDSEYPEVWTQAATLLPRMGAPLALPMLRTQLNSTNEIMRVRAALTLGALGNTEGIAYICRAARSGTLQERMLGCELLGLLQRTDQIPLLIEKLEDPHTNVRQVAAVALTRLKATQATSALAEAARGRLQNQQLPPALRGAQSDMNERVVMLACLRILKGEKEDLALYTLPSPRDQSWPEFDRELLKHQQEMLKSYKLVDVIPSGARGSGALIAAPGGQEILYREGEMVAAGFKVVDINLGATNPETKATVPPFVTLQRGNEIITLYIGAATETSNRKDQ